MTDNSNSIVPTGGNFLAPAGTVRDFLQAYQAKKDFISAVLSAGVDFGPIPGSDKPALKKPGAEKLVHFFGLSVSFVDVQTIEDWTGEQHGGEPLFYYRQRAEIRRKGELIAAADGSCNSWEKKYRYRSSERTCPNCGKATIIKGKAEYGGGWLCFAKKGGCGAKFAENAPEIVDQATGTIKNPDISDMTNTILKMAQKRALVAATLIATAASDYFTQDVEDFVDTSAVYIDGEYTDLSKAQATQQPPAESKQKPRQEQAQATQGHRADAPFVLDMLIDWGLAENKPNAAAIANKLKLAAMTAQAAQARATLYRQWRDAGADSDKAAENALAGATL